MMRFAFLGMCSNDIRDTITSDLFCTVFFNTPKSLSNPQKIYFVLCKKKKLKVTINCKAQF